MKPRYNSFVGITYAAISAVLFTTPSAFAAPYNWVGNTSGTWSTASNWSGGSVPLIADDLTILGPFNAAGVLDIVIDANHSANSLSFTNTAATSVTNATSGADKILTLGGGGIVTGAGTVQIGSNVANQAVNIALATAQNWNIGAGMTVANSISGLSTVITKLGSGSLTLNTTVANTFTGGLNVNGGNVTLDFVNLATPTNLIDSSNAIQLNNGSLTISGRNVAAATTAQTFASTLLGAGSNTINIAKGALATSATVNLGAISVNAGSSTIFSPTTTWSTTASTTERAFIAAGGSVPTLPAGTASAFVNAGVFHRVAGSVTAGSLRLAAVNSSGQLILKNSIANVAATMGNDPSNLYQYAAATSIALTNPSSSVYGLLLNATSASLTLTVANSGTLTLNSIMQIKATESITIAAGTGVSNLVIGSERNLVLAMDNAASLSINAPIVNNGAGASAVTIVGSNPAAAPGTVALGGANTYTGSTTITRGTLSINNLNALQNTSRLTLGGSSAATLSSTLTGITLAAPITIANAAVTSTIAFSRTTAAQGSLTLNGAISGAGNLTITTPNVNSGGNLQTINLGAASTYAGNTTLASGNNNNAVTVRNSSGAANALPVSTVLQLTGASGTGSGRTTTYELNGQNQTLAGLSNSISTLTARNQRISNVGTLATLTINGSRDSTFGGLGISSSFNGNTVIPSAQIVGAIALTKNGTGTFTLAAGAGNTFTGATTVLGGILSLGHPTSIQNSAFDTTNSITGDATNGLQTTLTALTLGGLTGNNSFASRFTTNVGGYDGLTALTLNPASGISHTYAADIGNGAGAMNLIKTGAGTQVLSSPQSYTGTTTGSAGTLLSSVPLPGFNVSGKIIFSGGTIGVVAGGPGWTTGQIDTLLVNATKTSGALGLDTSNGDLTQWAPFTTTNFGPTLGLNKLGANNLTLSQANTFAGTTTVSQGTLTLSNALALQSSSLVTTGAGSIVLSGVTTLNLGGLSGTSGDLATLIDGYSGITAINLNTPAGTLASYAGNIAEGATGMTLTKSGEGIQTLTGANTYTGATQVNGGILVFGNFASLAPATTATASATGTIGLGVKLADAAFYSATDVAALFNTNTLAGFNLNAASGVAIDTTAGTFDQTTALTAARSLTKLGANTLTLSTANDYSGVTNVLAGALSVTENTSLGTTAGATTIQGTAAITSLTLSSATTGLVLDEALNFRGNSLGRAQLLNDSIQSHTLSGLINVTSDTNLTQFVSNNNAGSLTITGDISGNLTNAASFILRGGSTGDNRLTGNVTLTGGSLVKTDAGTWTIGFAGKTINASGGLQVTNGILKMGADNVLASTTVVSMGAITGTNTGSLDLNGFHQTIAGITLLDASGNKSITNSGSPAVLTVNNATNFSTGTFVALTGGLSLTKQGAGTLTLAGFNSYSGNTLVNAGTLALADNAQLRFVIGGVSGANNSISGAGSATFDGDFVIETSAADAMEAGTWTLENVSTLTGAYGANFSVVGFVDAGNNKWTKNVSPTKKYTFDETTGILTLEVDAGFASWITSTFANGAVAPSKQGPNDDPDNDGVANLAEYAIAGQDPTVANPGIGSFTNGALTIAKRQPLAADITYAIQESTDLGLTDAWSEVSHAPPASPYVNNGTTISYTLNLGTPVRNFIRFQVTKNP